MTKFSKIRGGGVNNLENPKNNQNKKISKKSAFSLIELSIVLIIIGLLVAGVTGGASLIESAKIRSLANEINSYRTALYVFKTAKNKLPGDINNDGIIGRHYRGTGRISDEQTSNTFSGEYKGIDIAWRAGPFVDLFTEGLIDFKPYNGTGHTLSSSNSTVGKNIPISNAFKNMVFNGFYTYIDYTTSDINDRENNMSNGIHFWITMNGGNMNPKVIEKIDKKIDDGSYIGGNFRFRCDNKHYDYAIENGIECSEGMVKLIDI